ncbi:hypothetical protein ACG04Q_00495 [Roseateles sp. DXS20W]|uniref:Peptidase M60 domain-containing protein n=1 Tax=Pelomonas lactea TaxID=3299030 RepID=A0ABW7GDJ3_9BURK
MPACQWDSKSSPPPFDAFHVETIVDPFTLRDVVGMVRHPGWPYVVHNVLGDFNEGCCRIGLEYLDALQAALQFRPGEWLHPEIRKALEQTGSAERSGFGWLPCTELAPPKSIRRPLGSFLVERRAAAGAPAVTPSLLVLLAGSVDTKTQLQVGSDMGLRIVMQLHEGNEVRIHGVTLAGLTTRRALEVVPWQSLAGEPDFNLVSDVRKEIGRGLDCEGAVWVANIEKTDRADAPPNRLTASGYALRWPQSAKGRPSKRAARALTYDFRVELAVDSGSRTVKLVEIHRDLVIGAGVAETKPRTLSCFVQDAASRESPLPAGKLVPDLPYLQRPRDSLARRRTTLSDDELGSFRDAVDAELVAGDLLKFSDADHAGLFEVRAASARSTARLGGCTVASKGEVVTAGDDTEPPVRSDQQAAIDAHLRAAELFSRMLAYGLSPGEYFRFARLPLVHRVRPAMRWAPDGELPSAEVRPFLGDLNGTDGHPLPSDPLQLLVNYGSADPVHRRKLHLTADDGHQGPMVGRLKAQYLSVASDPRWAWHEFGHVLNFASTGELEFPFAHSAGDALAAIVADPISRLAAGADPDAPIRYVTYPWVEVPGRSHGRSPLGSYAWCGCRNLTRLDFTASLERYHHSYFGEQLMSSSLFRLYRSLGGDTRDQDASDAQALEDELTRLSASDYCVYLIMHGISLLGPDTLAPARTADQFVGALIDADLGTGAWNVEAAWPFNLNARSVRRQGGRVHKVIRWAFEQQGLYATDDPRDTAEGPGKPPRVDVFIADRRGDDGRAGDGGYAPVPLRVGANERWHAHRDWIKRAGAQLLVRVGNRGAQPAAGTVVQWWWTSDTPSASRVRWVAAKSAVRPQSVAGGGNVEFRLQAPSGTADAAWVLVSVHAPADPSNLTAEAPPSTWAEVLELVAHDNNLALAPL